MQDYLTSATQVHTALVDLFGHASGGFWLAIGAVAAFLIMVRLLLMLVRG